MEALNYEESSLLISHYHYLQSTGNVVSLSYDEDNTGRNVLSIGVININAPSSIKLPTTIIVFEMPQKWVKIPVQIFQQGVIKVLCEGGCRVCTDGLGYGGTLGINIHYRGNTRLLSAAHVLTMHDDTNIGKRVYVDNDGIVCPIAVVEGHEPVTVYHTNTVANPERFTQDLAWGKLKTEQWFPTVRGIGNINGIRQPIEKEDVQYYGATSLDVQEDIPVRRLNDSVTVTLPDGIGYVFYRDVIKLDARYTSIEEGDSGSALVAQTDRKVVGILISASTDFAYACKL